jgi:hypothetical protein
MALPAAIHSRRRVVFHVAFHDLRQDVVQAAQDLGGFRMMTGFELAIFLAVASRAVFGRNNGGDQESVMLEGVAIALFGLMAFETPHTRLLMSASLPLAHDSRRSRLMAAHARLALLAERRPGLRRESDR